LAGFEEIYSRAIARRSDVSPELKALLHKFYETACARPLNAVALKSVLVNLLEFLTTREGRTNSNCWAVDLFCMSDDWERDWSELPEEFSDILADMAGALHDTVKAPEIASNFDSTPEQLLERVKRIQTVKSP
jgi:hypothetical protein